MLAYQANIGQQVGDGYVHQQGTAAEIASSDGRPCPLQDFWTDLYECALMLCQAKDMRNCADYGNGRAAVVTLPQPGCMLKEEDGSVSGQMTTVPLPNAEAVIVYGVSTAPSNTSPPPPTVIANTPTRSLTSNAPTTPHSLPFCFLNLGLPACNEAIHATSNRLAGQAGRSHAAGEEAMDLKQVST
jgi:hypothetical protein